MTESEFVELFKEADAEAYERAPKVGKSLHILLLEALLEKLKKKGFLKCPK